MRRQSLVLKLALLVMTAVTAGMTVSALLLTWNGVERYAETRRQLMLATAKVFASAAARPVAELNQDETLEAIRAIGRLPGFQFVQVTTPDGRVLAALGGATRLLADSSLGVERTTSTIDLLRSGTVFISVPVVNGGEEVGQINLISDTADLWPGLRSTLWLILLASGAALAVGLVVGLRLQRAITQPLRRLLRAMQEVRRNHRYDLRVDAASDRDIGFLVDGFNDMLSEIRNRDERLSAYRETFEQKVTDRTRELASARDAAQKANLAKSDFVATMSHEIRTPMNGILVMADLLASANISPRLHRYAEVIAKSGKSLLSIINDILDFSKMEAGKLELESGEICVDEIVENVTSLFSERASVRRLDLAAVVDPNVPRAISGDPVRFTQVVSNLVNNALKFTEEGFVRIAVRKCTFDGQLIEISVEDSGIGIPEDKRATIFEVFSQADQSTARKFGGTGLGLAICRRIVSAMGGEIVVSSSIGAGSTFTVRLPVGEARSRPWPRLPVESSGRPVCIIDVSGEATASALSEYLDHFGYSVIRVESGMSIADYPSAAMVCADAARLSGQPRQLSGHKPIVVAVTPFGDPSADVVIANGLADATISRPLLRSEIEELLCRVAAGDTELRSSAAENRRGTSIPRFSNLTVLVADDNPVNREVATEALSQLGAHVETVENGVEAVSAAARRVHDIILMDGSMPIMDGFEAARIIRMAEDSENRHRVPIIALTAHVIGAAALEWKLAGMDAVLYKPFTVAQLASCLSDHVPQHRLSVSEPAAESDQEPIGTDTVSSAVTEVDPRLLDAGTLEQLRTLEAAKQGSFLERVVGLYAEHAPKALDQLKDHARAGDAGMCGSLSHSLKSMSLNIGAVEVARMAALLEQAARDESRVPCERELNELSDAIDRTVAVLSREVGKTPTSRPFREIACELPDAPMAGIERDLRLAIERCQLDVAYQPFVDRAGKQVLGVEALVRWTRAGTAVPPSVFVPIAERTGCIHQLGEWVLRRACEDARAWPNLVVAVNISAIQFRRVGLADRIERIFAESAIDPRRVELEITETALLDSEAAVLKTMKQLHRLGVSFALDDFGVGFSSLAALRRFPFDKIKVDRSFVSNANTATDATIVHAVVSIGRALGLKVVAEGVETIEQQRFVATAGVHALQGYLFAHPMNSAKVKDFTDEFNNACRVATVAVP